jgi:photosystem II stability/assembly factor-like uncharacterized protein
VLRSSDGGQTWESIATPVESVLFAVSFADERHGWVVGERGLLMRSRDGGRSWQVVPVSIRDPGGGDRPLDSHLFGISAVSDHEAWAVGDLGVVLHTRDGNEWSPVEISEEVLGDGNLVERVYNSVRFVDHANGWIVGEFATTLRTTDGGETWVAARSLEGSVEDLYLFDASAESGGRAAATGLAGAVLRTEDGGATWRPRGALTSAGLFGVSWVGSRGLVVGDRGELFLTANDGSTWNRPDRPRLFNWLRGVTLGSDGIGIAVGERGLILTSTDGGSSWTQTRGQGPATRAGVSVPEPGRSTDPGRTEEPPMAADTAPDDRR